MIGYWSTLFAPELIKMYGFNSTDPPFYAIESIQMGPLDMFLLNKSPGAVSTVCLIDASYSLARALHYLVAYLYIWCMFGILNLVLVIARKTNGARPHPLLQTVRGEVPVAQPFGRSSRRSRFWERILQGRVSYI